MLKRKRDSIDLTQATRSTWATRFLFKRLAAYSGTHLASERQRLLAVTQMDEKAKEEQAEVEAEIAKREAARTRIEDEERLAKQQAMYERNTLDSRLLALPLELRQMIFSYLLEGLHLHFCRDYNGCTILDGDIPRVLPFDHPHPWLTTRCQSDSSDIDPCANKWLSCTHCSIYPRGIQNTCHYEFYDYVSPTTICRQLHEENTATCAKLTERNIVSFDSADKRAGHWILPSAGWFRKVKRLWLEFEPGTGISNDPKSLRTQFPALEELHVGKYELNLKSDLHHKHILEQQRAREGFKLVWHYI